MRITNENIGTWLMILSVPFFWYLPDVIGVYHMFPNKDGSIESSFGSNLYYLLKIYDIIWGIFVNIIILMKFLKACEEGKVQFNVDLLAMFKSRNISPEEQDKKKK